MDRPVQCSCGERFSFSDLRLHRKGCAPLARELQRRRKHLAPPEWMGRARCDGYDVEDFFTDEAAYVTTPIERAMRVCIRCPVRRECLEYAYTHEATEEQGIYAGTRGRDRAAAKHRPDRIDYLLAQQDDEVRNRGLVMREEITA